MKTLTAYFSASHTTAALAERLAGAIGADLFEIRPAVPYTEQDLNWKNPFSRCNKEKFGKKEVAIEGKIEQFDAFDLVLIGFPIWYYGAPNIIESFLKQYDFSGKKIALFATSGGSNMGKTAEKLKPFLSDTARITAAKVFPADADAAALKAWVKEAEEG